MQQQDIRQLVSHREGGDMIMWLLLFQHIALLIKDPIQIPNADAQLSIESNHATMQCNAATTSCQSIAWLNQ
jgi:hypothetical protein